ncbi:helix-turn-helix transcriptional regulator [Cerasicoccus frondis]|uniref:helix-turn-helix transcriptional regulator n=1 Tax=Cerasicoccus frondis TaxID=490090 RepID=UPI0028527D81|nr:AraC family transcriptional regulator [Cerasicoccus frondis]
MSQSKAKTQILNTLQNRLQDPAERPIIRILQGKRPIGNQSSFFMETARIIVVLKGTGTFCTIEEEKETTLNISPGQMLFLSEGTWICPVPKASYTSLGMIFRDTSTRMTIHSRKVIRSGKQRVIPSYVAQWQTRETLGQRGKHIFALLREAAPDTLASSADTHLAKVLYANLISLIENASESFSQPQSILWQSVCDYLSEHWSDNDLTRESVASYFNRHPSHFSRFFHKHAKKNFRSYVNELRLQRSLILLKDLRYNVTDVAAMCGYTDLQYFIRCFRERYGLTPGRYRNRKEL